MYASRLFSKGPGAISVRSSESRTDVSDGFRRKSPRRKNDLRSNAVREGKSSRGDRLNAPGETSGKRALIMHDVSELRPLGFMAPVYAKRFT